MQCIELCDIHYSISYVWGWKAFWEGGRGRERNKGKEKGGGRKEKGGRDEEKRREEERRGREKKYLFPTPRRYLYLIDD